MALICEHESIDYDVTTRTVKPFHWKIHTLRCKTCSASAVVVKREKAR